MKNYEKFKNTIESLILVFFLDFYFTKQVIEFIYGPSNT